MRNCIHGSLEASSTAAEIIDKNNWPMYITKWIEGEQNLNDFCLRKFNETPRFIETIGEVGTSAKVHRVYKWREDKLRYTTMYLLFMEHPKGTVGDISDIRHQTYESIRANRSSLLIK